MEESLPFIRSVRLRIDRADLSAYPFTIPAVRNLGEVRLRAGVTFLVGENGSGKSTILEAIAVAAGLNPEGGSRDHRFSLRPTESELWDHLVLSRSPRRPADAFFLRAESFFNVATYLDAAGRPERHGGRSLHEQSHGESFLALVTHRFQPGGLYLLDEPEAALSVRGQLAMLRVLHDVGRSGAQVIVATHSPILLACPGATILAAGDGGLVPVRYEDCDPYQLYRAFLESPERFLRHLLTG